MDWQAIGLSLRLSGATTLILLAVGMPLAYWLTFSTRRWRFLVEAVVALPLVLPPTVLGFYVLMATGPYSPLGRGYEALTGGRLPFTFAGVLACYTAGVPFFWRTLASDLFYSGVLFGLHAWLSRTVVRSERIAQPGLA